MTIHPESIYNKSDHVIAQEVEEEFILVSIDADNHRSSEELYFLNETGRELWEHLNGKRNVTQLIEAISRQYRKDFHEQIRKDIILLMEDMLAHNIIVKI